MSLPSKLKKMNLFEDGVSFLQEVKNVTLPKLSRKTEEYIAGNMTGPVEIDFGHEALTMEFTTGGLVAQMLDGWGDPAIDGRQLRFAGAFQRGDDGAVDAVEVVMRGRHKEIDMGDSAVGEDTEHKVTSSLVFYQLVINGTEKLYIDVLNGIERVNGVDRTAAQRRAIGLV